MLKILSTLIFIVCSSGVEIDLDNNCKDFIESYYFDFFPLKNEVDYKYHILNDQYVLEFNFCQYVTHRCGTHLADYYMVIYNKNECLYLQKEDSFLLNRDTNVSLEQTYKEVGGKKIQINLNMICKRDSEGFNLLKIVDHKAQEGEKMLPDIDLDVFIGSKHNCPSDIDHKLYLFFYKIR